MNAGERAALWQSLSDSGLVTGECPATGPEPSPWYVRTMVGVAGWIAAAFLLGFLGLALTFITRNGPAAIGVGMLLCAAAIMMLRTSSSQEFLAQFALAASLAGQALVVTGLFEALPNRTPAVFIIIAVFEAALAMLASYSVHRTWSAFAAALAIFLALHEWRATPLFPGLAALAFAALQAAETRLVARASLWRATSAGVALALLAMVPAASLLDVSWLSGQAHPGRTGTGTVTGTVLMGLVLTGAVVVLLRGAGVGLSSRVGITALVSAPVLVAAAWPMPGVIAGTVVALCAFAVGRYAVTALGLVIAVAALSYYYYSLDVPLMTKALSLLAAGGVLIAVRYMLRSWVAQKESEVRHA